MMPWPPPDPVLLLTGDARHELARLPDACLDAIMTSPPYNLGASPSAYEHPFSSRGRCLDWQGYEDDPDALPEAAYQDGQVAVLQELYRVAKPGASCFYVHKDRRAQGAVLSPWAWLPRTPWHVRQQIVWDRGSGHEKAGWYFDPQHEYVFWLVKGDTHPNLGGAARAGSVWRIPVPIGRALRRAMWPLELPLRCLSAAGVGPGALVADPYCGSGQAGVAARRLGASFVGIDRSPAAIALSARRIAAVTTVRDLPLFAEVS